MAPKAASELIKKLDTFDVRIPQETLRFFYLDQNWTDAIVDGAVSLANHWDATPEGDFCRTAIKMAIQNRLDQPEPSRGGRPSQKPEYGFILRWQLLVQFPNIAVSAQYAESKIRDEEEEKLRAPILVQKRLSDDCMCCLFDFNPLDIKTITFTVPPNHQ
jgi:hypothetical protein